MTDYRTPMDQGYYPGFENNSKRSDTEQIFPIHMVGTTVVENDPTGRNKNVVESIEAGFKAGAGNVQLVMQTPGQTSAMGGGAKAYGESVREAIREVQKAAGAKLLPNLFVFVVH